ncbi:MAG: hypothetical protein AAF311_00970 [Pseudomonadota bacterium]
MVRLKTNASDAQVNLAILIHQNHDAVIAALKLDQWRYFTFGFGILSTFFLRPDVVQQFSRISIIFITTIVTLLTGTFIFRAQLKMKSRISELAHLQAKLGPAYFALRKTSAASKTSLFFRFDVWGFQVAMITGLLVLIIVSYL